MRQHNKNTSVTAGRWHWCRLSALGLIVSVAPPVWAIPSPDLVIGLSASVAQVLGLLSVVFTGMALSGRRTPNGVSPQKRSERSRAWRWFLRISVVMLIVSLAGNIFQHTAKVDEQNRRLHTNLVRSSVEAGKKVGDTSLKTLAMSDQIDHPLGIDNKEVATWLEQGRPVNLVDVREPEEVEMGGIEGSWHRRYPDLRRDRSGLFQHGKETVLICYSGNRSSELCGEFAQEGKNCRFVIGGYEKWMADGLPLELSNQGSPDQLRDIPDYPNKAKLLDTAQAVKLVADDDAVFVDVRYPREFAGDHLPGAINIPMRKLPTNELYEGLAKLPKQPLIAACYDKRSCFYSKVLGLRLLRMGYDYRGRYTLPHEFYLSQANAIEQSETLIGMVAGPLQTGLRALSEATGNFSLGILLLVLALRLATLPFTWKSERDRLVQRSLAPQVADLRQKINDDPPRLSRAIMHLYRSNRLTPVRNLVGTTAQLVLFLVFFSVVNRSAQEWTQSFLWLPTAASTDPSFVLPALASMLFFGYLLFTTSRRTWPFLVLYGAGGLLIWMLVHRLNAAVNLYLVINISLLFVQSMAFRLFEARASGRPAAICDQEADDPRDDPGVVSLNDAHKYPAAGHKARRLSLMIQAGLPVPGGFVVTSKILSGNGAVGAEGEVKIPGKELALLRRMWSKLGADKVAVRSSGLNEDGTSHSYAGVFESLLNVSRQDLFRALNTVLGSMNSERSSAYSGGAEEKGGALVQKMVDAHYAGVLFTEHPSCAGLSLIEMVSGLGDSLVSGKVTPTSYRFGAVSGRAVENKNVPIDLAPLVALGREVEKLFGRPQDIEWAYCDGKFLLLQARDITSSVCDNDGKEAALEMERRRLLQLAPDVAPDQVFLAQTELSELLPRPTPLSASLMEKLWASGGSTDLACRSLGIPYDVQEDSSPYVTTVFGALYVNRHEELMRLRRTPGPVAAFWLARNAETIEADFREGFLPGFLKEMREKGALNFARLTTAELLTLTKEWVNRFINEAYVQAEVINVATDFYWKTAYKKLERRGIDPALYLGDIPQTVVHRAMSLLTSEHPERESLIEFLGLFGHRAPQDYELAQPRYRESPKMVLQQISCANSTRTLANQKGDLPTDPVLRLAVDRAKRFQVLKEDAKHQCLRQLALLRKLLLTLDKRFSLEEGVFYLTLEEVMNLDPAGALEKTRERIDRRRTQAKVWKNIRLPSELTIEILERLTFTKKSMISANIAHQSPAELKGKRVAGEGGVMGHVQVIHDPEDVKNFIPGDIVVARFTDPTWYPLFPKAGGIITEVGGWLSHAAIVAREQNLTAIVGVKGAAETLKTDQLVRLNANGTIDILVDQRSTDSPMRPRRKGQDVTSEQEELPAIFDQAEKRAAS